MHGHDGAAATRHREGPCRAAAARGRQCYQSSGWNASGSRGASGGTRKIWRDVRDRYCPSQLPDVDVMSILLWILAVLLVVVGFAGILLPALPGTVLIFAG